MKKHIKKGKAKNNKKKYNKGKILFYILFSLLTIFIFSIPPFVKKNGKKTIGVVSEIFFNNQGEKIAHITYVDKNEIYKLTVKKRNIHISEYFEVYYYFFGDYKIDFLGKEVEKPLHFDLIKVSEN